MPATIARSASASLLPPLAITSWWHRWDHQPHSHCRLPQIRTKQWSAKEIPKLVAALLQCRGQDVASASLRNYFNSSDFLGCGPSFSQNPVSGIVKGSDFLDKMSKCKLLKACYPRSDWVNWSLPSVFCSYSFFCCFLLLWIQGVLKFISYTVSPLSVCSEILLLFRADVYFLSLCLSA